MKKILTIIMILIISIGLTSCNDADTASRNLSKAADMFEIDRRIIFYNGITGEYILTIEGKCSI
jgi:predicted small secreted protein